MGTSIRLTLPILYKITNPKGSKKKFSYRAISFNWYIGLSPYKRSEVKKNLERVILKQLKNYNIDKITKYKLSAHIYYHKLNLDLCNIFAIGVKALEDSLIKGGVTTDDSVFYCSEYHVYGEMLDTDEPRIEFILTEIDELEDWSNEQDF